MLSLKKVYRDELLQLALILSLLRGNNGPSENDLLNNPPNYDFDNGTSWRSLTTGVLRSHFVHPKSLDSVLLNYERDLFADLNLLGRYNRDNYRHSDVTTYLLNIERSSASSPLTAQVALDDGPAGIGTAAINQSEEIPILNETAPIAAVGLELTQEDMDLIEVLWKQDVDLGFSLDAATAKLAEKPDLEQNGTITADATTSIEINDIEKLKEKQGDKGDDEKNEDEDAEIKNPWEGLNYTIDTETGECVIKAEELTESSTGADCGPSCDLPLGDLSLPLPEFLLDEALRLVELDDTPKEGESVDELEKRLIDSGVEASTSQFERDNETGAISTKDTDDDLDILENMIQTSQYHPHHRAFQGRMPFVRTMSMEQRWQDLANLLSLPSPGDATGMAHPFSHHHPLHNYSHSHAHGMGYSPEATRGVLLHNATLNPPMGDINATVPYTNIGGTNLGNAVATSMNLTNSSEPMGDSNSTPHYKLEPSHDMMYYQNTTSELNQTDGLLSSFLNDEDLQLMDMAMNEGMYTMRMLDSNSSISNLSMSGNTASGTAMTRTEMERVETSSDSAVSSMGSERVPSLSDGEWCDAGSDSGHTTGDHYVTDYQTKYRPYDYSYTGRPHALGSSDAARVPPVAQKKHQMFGKRYLQEQSASIGAICQPPTPAKYDYRADPVASATSYNASAPEGAVGPKPLEMKYSCSVEFGRHGHLPRNAHEHVQHNHTYHLPAESTGAMLRPISRDKVKAARKSEDEHLTRDEKRARALSVPITVDDIINLPMDEFNERLSKYDLSEAQLSLIRDIRRRGKNKVAAQNCRKRKLDQILSLADEVKDMRDRKMRLVNDHEFVSGERQRLKDKYQQLYRHVFQNLRDPDGNQYSPYQYSLQTSADGSILVVPRSNSTLANPERKEPSPQGRKD